jgi:DNA invertase Pin-like site-specific DNA recombinase
MVFDGTTTDPMQQAIRDSLLAFMAAAAQAQEEVTKEAGIAHARAIGNGTKYRGRKPTFTCEQFVRVRELLDQGIGLAVFSLIVSPLTFTVDDPPTFFLPLIGFSKIVLPE